MSLEYLSVSIYTKNVQHRSWNDHVVNWAISARNFEKYIKDFQKFRFKSRNNCV